MPEKPIELQAELERQTLKLERLLRIREAVWEAAHVMWPYLTGPGERNLAYHDYLNAWERHLRQRRLVDELARRLTYERLRKPSESVRPPS